MRVIAFFPVLLASGVFITHGLSIQNDTNQSIFFPGRTESLNEKVAIRICPGGRTSGKHIVEVQEGRPRTAVLALIKSKIIEIDLVNSFIGFFDTETLDAIQSHPDVSFIAEECFMEIATTLETFTQPTAPWGLARLISSQPLSIPPDGRKRPPYPYNFYSAGTCADVYIVDSGINTGHVRFQGRAIWGASFGNYGANAMVDESGHGTHVAGIVGSSIYGVAKGVRLIAVKVVGDSKFLEVGNLMEGLAWISRESPKTGRPSVVNLSLSTRFFEPAINRAVEALIKMGIHVVVAAGNRNQDAYTISPASVPSAITVGASNIFDRRHRWSNYGPIVDVFAPGEDILSTFIGNNDATSLQTGTSMAVPFVSGWIACFLCIFPLHPPPTPAYMQQKVKEYALKDVLTDIPQGTANRLLHFPSQLW